MQKGVRSRIGLWSWRLARGAVKRMQRKFRLSSLLHNMRLRWSPRRSKMAAAQTNSTLAAFALRAHFDSVILPMWMGPASTRRSGYPSNHWMPLPGIRCPPNVIARWRARASSTCVEASGPTRPRMPTACSSPCAPISRMRAAAGVTAWTRRRVRWTRPRISIPTPSSCSPAPRISGARATPGRASSCWARRKPSRPASSGPTVCTKRLSLRTGAARGPAQNPMMHLTEAYLAAAQVAEPALFAQRARWRRASPSISCMRPRSACPRRRREPRTTGMSPAISLNGCPWWRRGRSV